MNIYNFIAIYVGFISVISLMLTVYDKVASMAKKWRIPEKMLMSFAFLGGATVMYITMQIIRHKTKHKNFMYGLPVMILIHIVVFLIVFYI